MRPLCAIRREAEGRPAAAPRGARPGDMAPPLLCRALGGPPRDPALGEVMARILVAEDEASVREFVARALRLHGHEVTAVEDGAAALEALAVAPYELLLTDIVMPGLDGIALALKVSRDHPAMPVLLMSGFAAERQRAHNLSEIVCRVVPKPFTLKEICAAVAEELAKSAPVAALG